MLIKRHSKEIYSTFHNRITCVRNTGDLLPSLPPSHPFLNFCCPHVLSLVDYLSLTPVKDVDINIIMSNSGQPVVSTQ